MDKLENYRLYIQKLLERHSHFKTQDDIENELIFDTVRDRYQLMRIGWKGLKRVYHNVLHFDIKDGKIRSSQIPLSKLSSIAAGDRIASLIIRITRMPLYPMPSDI